MEEPQLVKGPFLQLTTSDSRDDQILAIDERLKNFQFVCNQKLAAFSEFFNGHLDSFVQQILVEIQELSADVRGADELLLPYSKPLIVQEHDNDDSAANDDCFDDFPPEIINDVKEFDLHMLHEDNELDLESPTPTTRDVKVEIDNAAGNFPTTSPQPTTSRSKKMQKSFQCDVCPKMLSTKQSFIAHRRGHSGGPGTIQCDICQRRFNLKQSLTIHMRTHSDERPYMCHLCSRTFKQSTPFRRHMRTHTLDKPHQCTMCERAFIEKSYLKVHMQSHTGERPHICPVCNRGYTKRYHVRQHLKNFHKVDNVNEVFPQNQRRPFAVKTEPKLEEDEDE